MISAIGVGINGTKESKRIKRDNIMERSQTTAAIGEQDKEKKKGNDGERSGRRED
jgi:hypothetical protein